MSARVPDTHAEAWALLPWIANGRLTAAEREWVDAHVAACAECRAELAAQRQLAAALGQADAGETAGDEQRSFDRLWARIEAAEAAAPEPVAAQAASPARASRLVRWLVAAVVVQAIGLGVLGIGLVRGDASRAGEFETVADPEPGLAVPAVRLVFAPRASVETINTLLAHQGLSIVSGPGTQGNYTAVLSPEAVASGASAESVARVIARDPNVSFAQPVAR